MLKVLPTIVVIITSKHNNQSAGVVTGVRGAGGTEGLRSCLQKDALIHLFKSLFVGRSVFYIYNMRSSQNGLKVPLWCKISFSVEHKLQGCGLRY